MSKDYHFYVYILSSRSRNLYIGFTNDLFRRMEEHRSGQSDSHTKQYKIHRLVYFEHFGNVLAAIAREKELKLWLRSKKIALIEAENPTWDDLYPRMLAEWDEKLAAVRAMK